MTHDQTADAARDETGGGRAFWAELERDVVTVSGADAATFLHSQISQDIRALAEGAAAYTFVLEPTGKVNTLARVVRTAPETFRFDIDTGFGDVLLARLNRFKIRVKADTEQSTATVIAVRGFGGGASGASGVSGVSSAVPAWRGGDAIDLFGASCGPAGTRHGSAADLLVARIEAGWPAMGREITDASIPAETGVVAEAVSFTKGCYPGQELVERMDSRGSAAPRFVRRLRGEGDVAVGDEIALGDKVVGELTSVAATDEGWIALGIVARAASAGDAVIVNGAVSVIEDVSTR